MNGDGRTGSIGPGSAFACPRTTLPNGVSRLSRSDLLSEEVQRKWRRLRSRADFRYVGMASAVARDPARSDFLDSGGPWIPSNMKSKRAPPRRAAALSGLATLTILQSLARGQGAPEGGAPQAGGAGETKKSCCALEQAPLGGPEPTDRKSVSLRTQLEQLRRSTAPLVGEGNVADLEAKIALLPKIARTGPPTNPQVQRFFSMRFALGDAYLAAGRPEDAVAIWQDCLDTVKSANDGPTQGKVLRKLALAWLRVGERQNCVTNHNQDSCLLPLRGGGIHVDKRGSEEAVRCLTQMLAVDGKDLASIWLLNVAHMTLGTWPNAVPAAWRIPARAFASERELPRMPDIAPKLGLNVTNHAGGSAMDDFDGDGRLEIVITGSGLSEPIHLFHQQPDGTFREDTVAAGLAGQVSSLNFLHFDANNDGRLDLLLQRGAWWHDFGQIPNSLLIQQPDGTFVDRTLEAGIEVSAPSQTAAAADVDNDGDLDLYLGYEYGGRDENFPCKLFRNRGDGTFEDVTKAAGVECNRYVKGVNFGDYDNDGLPDLYVSTMNSPNRLYHNDGDCKFHDVALELGVADPNESFSCFFFDYNNDGWLDLYVACYNQGQRILDVGAWYKNGATGFDTQRLYENDGHGGFRDVTRLRAMDRTCFPMGSNFGDVDNDGWPDLYLATGDPEFGALWPNVMLHNDGGRRFEDVTSATGTGHLQKGHGVSFGDVDGDGDQDLFVELGGALKDDAFHDALFQNPGHGNHWLTVRLVGVESNRFGVGARLKATIAEAGPDGAVVRRDVHAVVGGNSSFGGNSLQAEIGLGRAQTLLALEVRWPRTGKVQAFTDVPLDTMIVVEEGRPWRRAPPPGAAPSAPGGAAGLRAGGR